MAGLVGKVYPEVRYEITAAAVEAFARALGAEPDGGVPPTFAAVYALGTTAPQLFSDPEAAVDLPNLLHAEQEFTWTRHPAVGERVVAEGRIAADSERRGFRFLTLETKVRREGESEAFVTSRSLFLVRSQP